MKIPKKIMLCGKPYVVTLDSSVDDGGGSTHKQKIVVGCKGQQSERIFDTFLHEVAELSCCENNFRYGDGHSETSVFVMSHKDFERFIGDLSSVLFPLLI